MQEDEALFDPAFLGRLRVLLLKLRKRRLLQKRGATSTPAAGFTREFKDHRPYISGDDFRSVDWRLFARLEKLFIRIFEEVQEFHLHLLIDTSMSMKRPHPGKRQTALRLAAALAHLGLAGQHRVSLMRLGDTVSQLHPPVKGQGNIHRLLSLMAGLEFGGTSDFETSLGRWRADRSKRGMVFVISDFFGRDLHQAERAVEAAGRWDAETHFVQILDPAEINPDLEGEWKLIDVETGEQRRFFLNRRDRDRLHQEIESYLRHLETSALRREINLVRWTTDQDFEEMFVRLLARGSALADSG